jgi:5-formyltetrahydrofolate cyclo-ligase
MPVTVEDVDFMIVPGLAFDENGNRLGYGAGFYDRLLPYYKKETAALAFEIQIVPEVPISSLDIPVKQIVTEKRTIVINKF